MNAILDGTALRAPSLGWFTPRIADGSPITPGLVLGTLDILGRESDVVAPDVHGVAKLAHGLGRRAVGYGEALFEIDHVQAREQRAPTTSRSDDLVFRAPTSGRFYGRPSPDKPPYVAAGSELAPGTTICLLEVMKTFNRVTYSGTPVRVRDVLVAEGADVNAGDALLALEAM